MLCPACGYAFDSEQKECPRCGLIISRYKKRPDITKESATMGNPYHPGGKDQEEQEETLAMSLLFYVKPQVDSVDFGLRLVFALIISLWGAALIFTAKDGQGGGFGFWHLVNLPFHEAGHVIFRPFGHLIMSFGGSVGQLAMPLVCMSVFLLKNRDVFAAGFCLWWVGVNFIDLAPYIGDARSLTLPLLGGNTGESSPYGFHDWEYILTETNLLSYDKALSNLSFALGSALMIISVMWWVKVLKTYHQRIKP